MSVDLHEFKGPGDVFDALQARFGIGWYDDLVANDPPYHRVRMTEIAKIKAMTKKRRLSWQDWAVGIWYCDVAGIPVTASWEVVQQIDEGYAAMRAANRAREAAAEMFDVEDVMAEAWAAGEHEFAVRLQRADPAHQRALMDEWRARGAGDDQ